MSITASTLLRRSDAVLHSDLGEKTVMMDLEEGLYFGLNEVAGRIWALLETPSSLAQICDRLVDEFEVSREECETAVRAFAEELLSRKLVVRDDG